MMLDKKANSSGFLSEFKMGGKAAETTHITNPFGPETANECTVAVVVQEVLQGS